MDFLLFFFPFLHSHFPSSVRDSVASFLIPIRRRIVSSFFFFFFYTHWFIINTLQNVDTQLWTVRLYYVFGLSLKFDRTSVRYGMETGRNSKWPNCLKNVPLKYTRNFAFTSLTIFPIFVKTDFFRLICVIHYNLLENVTTSWIF